MSMIKRRIHSPYYRSLDQFKDDFMLMFNNARIFNQEGSDVYEDANKMQVYSQRTNPYSLNSLIKFTYPFSLVGGIPESFQFITHHVSP